jgi:hypothetical protein
MRLAQKISADTMPMYEQLKAKIFSYMRCMAIGTKLNNHKVSVGVDHVASEVRVALEMLVEEDKLYVISGARGTLHYFIPSGDQRRMKQAVILSREDRPVFRAKAYEPKRDPAFNLMLERVVAARDIKSKF